MATHKEHPRLWLLFFLAFFLGMSCFFFHAPTAHAASRLTGYSLTIAAPDTSFEFGTGNHWVIGTLTLPGAPTTDQYDGHCFFQIDGQQTVAPSVRLNGPPWNATFDLQLPLNLAIGTHTAIAGFNSVANSTTIYSDPITITVHKITSSLTSILGNFMDYPFWPAGKSYAMEPGFSFTSDQRNISDWKTGTYTLTFTGPQNVTYTNLALNSAGDVTFTFPAIKGDYQFTFTFNGTNQLNATSENGTIKITNAKAVTISLYSTPATTTEGKQMQYYVVVAGVAGYPPPTGKINFYVGNYVSNYVSLDSNGTARVSITWLAVTGSSLEIRYYGDYNYASSGYARFPLTNPTTPTGGSTNPTASPSTNATPSSTPAATATTTAAAAVASTASAATATPTPGGQTHLSSASTKRGSGNAGIWILWATIALVLCASAFGILLLRRNKLRSSRQNSSSVLSSVAATPDDK